MDQGLVGKRKEDEYEECVFVIVCRGRIDTLVRIQVVDSVNIHFQRS